MRPPAVAGLFYPEDADRLRASVAGHLAAAAALDPPVEPLAVIVPHAGYRYSGSTAAAAYRALAGRRGTTDRVVLVGPAHRVPVAGVGVSTARAWRTPLGEVPVDVEACRALVTTGVAVEADDAHAPEHSLEVHLPFLLEVLGPVAIVPLVVGRGTPAQVAAALDRVWDGDATLVVASSDLSHYLDEDTARARDDRTCRAIVDGRTTDIGPHDACGFAAVGGLLDAARARGLAPRTLDVRTSAAPSGDRSRVVGYASFAFERVPPLGDVERRWLVARARAAIREGRASRSADRGHDEEVPERLRRPGASFVTLQRAGALTGCVGSLEPVRPLWHDVVLNARRAAYADPRFPSLTADHLDDTVITVSVLSPLEPLPAPGPLPDGVALLASVLRPGVDGLLLETRGRRGTLLPSVWETLPTPDRFLAGLLAKLDVGPGEWPTDVRAWRYTTDEFGP